MWIDFCLLITVSLILDQISVKQTMYSSWPYIPWTADTNNSIQILSFRPDPCYYKGEVNLIYNFVYDSSDIRDLVMYSYKSPISVKYPKQNYYIPASK